MHEQNTGENVPKLRVGIIGCGQIFKQHHQACQELSDDFELIAVCDNKEDRAQKAGETAQVPWHSDYTDLIARDDIDVVSICTPHHLHVPMALKALEAGKHVIIEKPIGLNVAEVDRLIARAQELDRKIFSVLQVRHNPPLICLRDLLDASALGQLYTIALVVRWYRPQEYYTRSDWHGRKESEGGFLLSQGIHYIDTLRWAGGPVKSVVARVVTAGHDIETEDLVHALVEFESGAVATVEMSLCTYPRNLECSLAVSGSQGSIKINGTALDNIETWEVQDREKPILEEGLGPNVYAGGLYQGSCPNHAAIYRDAINHLRCDAPYITPHDAKEAIRLVEAMYESARTGNKVML